MLDNWSVSKVVKTVKGFIINEFFYLEVLFLVLGTDTVLPFCLSFLQLTKKGHVTVPFVIATEQRLVVLRRRSTIQKTLTFHRKIAEYTPVKQESQIEQDKGIRTYIASYS